MELTSTINNSWKVCLMLSLIGCLILLLFNQNNQYTTFSSTSQNTAIVVFSPLVKSNTPISPIFLPPTNISSNNNPQQIEEKSAPVINHTAYHRPILPLNMSENGTKNTIILNRSEEGTNHTIVVSEKMCNMFDGKWVYKPEEFPIYDSNNCPFVEEKMSCRKNGRPDFEYEKWRWEATNCDIPLFNGRDMLEKLRNKRMIIVGDSLNRNMWESLACLLYSSVPSSRAEVNHQRSDIKVLEMKDYNAVIEFHWSPFLIEYDMKNHRSGKKVLVLDKLSPNSKQWRGADVMVFNSAYWWTHKQKLSKWDLYEYKGQLVEDIPIEIAYERGMKTWAKWIEKNVNPKKTVVFFRSISAQHNAKYWCYNSTQPILDESLSEKTFPKYLVNVIERQLNQMRKTKVRYLNITKLSEYRIDAHPSLYKTANSKDFVTKHKRLIRSSTDCSHWCLPGLPDTWNRLLYASLFFDASN